MNENELILNEMGEMAKIGGWSFDLKTNTLTWTNEVYKIHEVDKNFVPTVENAINFYDDSSQEIISSLLNETIKSGTPYDTNLKLITAKGNKIDVRSIGKAVRNDKGVIEKVFGTFQNITEKLKAENRLKKSEYKFRILADNTNDWEYWINQNNEYVFISKSCKRITGYSKEEFLKNPDLFINLVREDYKEEVFNHYHTKDRTGPLHTLEFPIINKDNKEVWIEHKCNPIFDKEGEFLGRRGNNRDITEKKILEIESKKLTKVVEQSPNSIVITDINGTIEYVNPKFTEITGYTEDEALGKNPNILSSGNQSKAFYADLWETIIRGEVWKGRLHNKKKNGELYWEDATITPIKNDIGEVINFLAIKKDITELKLKEEKLLQSDRVFNLALDMFCIAGFDGYFKYLNPAWERTLGWSTEEMLSKPWLDFVHPDDIKKTENVKSVLIDGKEIYQFENRYICKDGSTKWLSWKSQPYPEENIMIGVARDITDAKRIENDLLQAKEKAEKSEKKLLEAQKLSHVGSWEYFIDTDVVTWSKELYNIFEYPYNLPPPKFSKQKNIYTEESFSSLEKAVKDCVQREIPYEINLDIYTSDGSIKHIISKGDIKKINNKVVGAYGTAQDITLQKQLELELIQAKEKAEESDRLKSAFLANMSHEIRTPMNGILGFTQLLDNANLSFEKQKKYIEILQISSKRLLNTVNDIIEISKIESGLVNIVKSEVDLIELLNTTVIFFQPEAEKKGLKLFIKNEIAENKLNVFTDKNKMSSIFSNLIKNAIKFTDRGTIEVGLKIEEDNILFSCKDSGIGIPKSRQKAIFDRFVQADIEDKQAREGTGLGLTIVKSIIEMFEGEIWLKSEEGKGSEFFVSLPYTPIDLKKKVSILKKKPLNNIKKNIHILVAEDDELSALHLSIIIKELSANVTIVDNGIDAVEKCKNDSSIDLVLMDIKMPKMNGHKATKEIRKFNKEIIIIAQTAFVLEGDKQKALDAGCTDYVSKPISTKKLIELINKYN